MAGIGKAIKGLGLLAKKYKKGVAKKASVQTGKKKYIKRNPYEGESSQASDWPYWRGEE